MTGVRHGRVTDAVIYPWYETRLFPVGLSPEDYVVFCGRIQTVKGIQMAQDAARAAGVRLVVIGHGDRTLVTYGEVHDSVSSAERNRLMAGAQAVIMPTQYIEPFGNVAAEAQLCGTPLIGPDFGAFSETIEQGMTGYRCTGLDEYVQAIEHCQYLSRQYVRQRAERLFSEATADAAYATYFERLPTQSGVPAKEMYGSVEVVA